MKYTTLVLCTALALLMGCRQQSSSLPAEGKESKVPAAAGDADSRGAATTFPLQLTDGLGRELTLANTPRRIVSLGPKNTELLFALGAGDQVVGVTTYCTYPPAAISLQKVGGFSSKSLSLEQIVSLQPDLVLSAGNVHSPIIAELEQLKLPVCALTADTLGELRDELELLGRITGHELEAASLLESLNERLDRIQRIAADIPVERRVSMLYVVWVDPLTAAGPHSYLGEMIELCGGKNIIDDATTSFPKISLELLVSRDPQVIVTSTNHAGLFAKETLQAQTGWGDLQAVRNNRVYLLDGDLVSRCGPRLVDALELMAHATYPDHFPPADPGQTDRTAEVTRP